VIGLIAFTTGFSIYFFLDDPPFIPPPTLGISPRVFTASKLISSEFSGPNTKLLKFAAPRSFLAVQPLTDGFEPIWSVYIKDDDIQVERAYTPRMGVDGDGNLLFWVKNYPKGEVGRWLHSKIPGDSIEMRGPLKTWPWKEDAYDEIVMISGGTGITPFIQLFNRVISNPTLTSHTRFTLLHSSRIPGELPPPALFDPLTTFSKANPEKFKFHVFVDEKDGSISPSYVPSIKEGRVTEKELKSCIVFEKPRNAWWMRLFGNPAPQDGTPRRILFLVCGPEAMVGAIAGPYGRNLSQGPVGGILGKMGYSSDQVYKL